MDEIWLCVGFVVFMVLLISRIVREERERGDLAMFPNRALRQVKAQSPSGIAPTSPVNRPVRTGNPPTAR